MTRPDTARLAESEAGVRDQGGERVSSALPREIVDGTRSALGPPGDARHDLIDAAIARVARRRLKLERPPARWEVALAGFLVALAMFVFLVGRMTEMGSVPLVVRVVASVVGGGAVAAYLWRRDRAS